MQNVTKKTISALTQMGFEEDDAKLAVKLSMISDSHQLENENDDIASIQSILTLRACTLSQCYGEVVTCLHVHRLSLFMKKYSAKHETKPTPRTAVSCICGSEMTQILSTASSPRSCDICGCNCSENESIYHCENGNMYPHIFEYDICCKCAEGTTYETMEKRIQQYHAKIHPFLVQLLMQQFQLQKFDEQYISSVAQVCINDIGKCVDFLNKKLTLYPWNQPSIQKDNEQISEMDLLSNCELILDDFLHVMSFHKEEFEWIYHKLGGFCDIHNCQIFTRNHRDRNECSHNHIDINDLYQTKNHTELFLKQLLDKIHCFYQHSFDIGYKLREFEKRMIQQSINEVNTNQIENEYLTNRTMVKINEIVLKKQMNFRQKCSTDRTMRFNQFTAPSNDSNHDQKCDKAENEALYYFGFEFKYQKDDKDDLDESLFWLDDEKHPSNIERKKRKNKDFYAGDVYPKYKSLKEEITNNSHIILTIPQFNNELQKSSKYFHSYYGKNFEQLCITQLGQVADDYKPKGRLKLHHFMSILLYCNYDVLQYELSKTYRRINKQENKESVKKRHSEFHFFAKYLAQMVNWFGTIMSKGKIASFYHGINQELLFPVRGRSNHLFVPLSTTSSYEVAVTFSRSDGFVIEFCESLRYGDYGLKYFSTSWLSDFPSELEHLFVQNKCAVGINIRNIVDIKLGCEYQIILMVVGHLNSSLIPKQQINESIVWFIQTLIKQELNTSTFVTLNTYAKKLFHQHCVNRQNLALMYPNRYPFKFFLSSTIADWIDLKFVQKLYSNLESIEVRDIKISSAILNNILLQIKTHCQSKLYQIRIHWKKNDDHNAIESIISKYRNRFSEIKWNIDVLKVVNQLNITKCSNP